MLVFEKQDPVLNYRLQIHKFEETFNKPPQSFLSKEEWTYSQTLHSDKRKNEYLQSRYVLKSLISAKIGEDPTQIHFAKIGQGKPVLASSEKSLDFNLSHSGAYFAIVFTEKGQVGVDIEEIRIPPHLQQIAKKYFAESEMECLLGEISPQDQARIFTKLWSGKEALIKAVGGGVFKNVHDIAIDGRSWQIQKLPLSFSSLSHWHLHYYEEVQGLVCCVACKN